MKKILYMPIRLVKMLRYKLLLGSFGWKSILISPMNIQGRKEIFIGNNVIVGYKVWLAAMCGKSSINCKEGLFIEEGCRIGNFNHIYATKRIVIHSNVLTADKVYISDNIHGYEDPNIPIYRQPIIQKPFVEIGEGSWLGENVCVIGATIGKHCVIGANSVVTNNIPDYSVAVGSPARVIKRYDFENKTWVKEI